MRGLIAGLVATRDPSDEVRVFVDEGQPFPFDGAAVTRVPGAAGPVRYLRTLPKAVRRHRADLDAVVSVTHAPVHSGVPSALLVTDLSFVHHPEYFPPTVRKRLQWVVPRQARAAAIVLTISEFCRGQILDAYDLDPERVFVVPCVVEPDAAPSAADLAHARAGLVAQGVTKSYFLSLGNLHARKNTTRVIEAFVRATSSGALRDHQLVIAGARWFRDGPEAEAARKAGADDVVFLGAVDEPTRHSLLSRATALTYPSLFEGFGLPPLEAMAAGTPALVSDRAALPETCGDAALVVDPLDVDAIAAGLVELATDEVLRAQLIERGLARSSTFTVDACGAHAWRALRHIRGAVPA